MPPEADQTEQPSVVVASFENRHAAEHLLALLGRQFGKQARKGHVTAFVIRGNKDGSLKLTQSRVLTAEGLEAALVGFTDGGDARADRYTRNAERREDRAPRRARARCSRRLG